MWGKLCYHFFALIFNENELIFLSQAARLFFLRLELCLKKLVYAFNCNLYIWGGGRDLVVIIPENLWSRNSLNAVHTSVHVHCTYALVSNHLHLCLHNLWHLCPIGSTYSFYVEPCLFFTVPENGSEDRSLILRIKWRWQSAVVFITNSMNYSVFVLREQSHSICYFFFLSHATENSTHWWQYENSTNGYSLYFSFRNLYVIVTLEMSLNYVFLCWTKCSLNFQLSALLHLCLHYYYFIIVTWSDCNFQGEFQKLITSRDLWVCGKIDKQAYPHRGCVCINFSSERMQWEWAIKSTKYF